MSISISIPNNSQPIWTANIFTAAFNVPTLNRYDFTNTVANQNQISFQLLNKALYYIDRIAFSSNIPVEVFQQALIGASLPFVSIKKSRDNQQIYLRQLNFLQFYEGLELNCHFYTNQVPDQLLLTFGGVFLQPGPIAGLPALSCFVQLSIYEITDIDFLNKWQRTRA